MQNAGKSDYSALRREIAEHNNLTWAERDALIAQLNQGERQTIKRDIIEALERERNTCKKLEEKYLKEWGESIATDKIKADCMSDLMTLFRGQALAYADAIKKIEEM